MAGNVEDHQELQSLRDQSARHGNRGTAADRNAAYLCGLERTPAAAAAQKRRRFRNWFVLDGDGRVHGLHPAWDCALTGESTVAAIFCSAPGSGLNKETTE